MSKDDEIVGLKKIIDGLTRENAILRKGGVVDDSNVTLLDDVDISINIYRDGGSMSVQGLCRETIWLNSGFGGDNLLYVDDLKDPVTPVVVTFALGLTIINAIDVENNPRQLHYFREALVELILDEQELNAIATFQLKQNSRPRYEVDFRPGGGIGVCVHICDLATGEQTEITNYDRW